jgi:hypothetical protein
MVAYKAMQADLPDLDQVLIDPVGSPVPSKPDAQWLISMALSTRLACGTFGPVLTYLQRLPVLFRSFSIRSAFQAESVKRSNGLLPAGYKPLAMDRDFASWGVTEEGKSIISAGRAS